MRPEHRHIVKVWGEYLRDEERFDRWGGLGKVLVTVETLGREGLALLPPALDRFVNEAFPRTFSSPLPGEPGKGADLPTVRREYRTMLDLLARFGVPAGRVEALALEEAGERSGLGQAAVRDLLGMPPK